MCLANSKIHAMSGKDRNEGLKSELTLKKIAKMGQASICERSSHKM